MIPTIAKQPKSTTYAAAYAAIRRLCRKNARGVRKVSETVAKQFTKGGKSQEDLIRAYQECGGDTAPRLTNLANLDKTCILCVGLIDSCTVKHGNVISHDIISCYLNSGTLCPEDGGQAIEIKGREGVRQRPVLHRGRDENGSEIEGAARCQNWISLRSQNILYSLLSICVKISNNSLCIEPSPQSRLGLASKRSSELVSETRRP